jgi:hypothetical protein
VTMFRVTMFRVTMFRVTMFRVTMFRVTMFRVTRGPFLTSPFAPGVYLAPGGEVCLLGGVLSPSFTPRGEHSILFRRMEG